jgi:transporter family protein
MVLSVEDLAIALSATVCWALTLTINKILSRTVGSVFLNTLRLWSGFATITAFVWIFGKYESISSHSGLDLVLLVASGVVALAIGDTVLIRSLSFIYVSQAFPVSQCGFVVLTTAAAILFLSEVFTLLNIVGGGLILGGLYLVVGFGHQTGIPSLKSANSKGLLLAFSTALAWATGAVILKLGLAEMNPVFAASIRTFSAAAALTVFQYGSHATGHPLLLKNTTWEKISLTVLSGIAGYGLAGIAYVASVQRVGAGRTALITSLTPVFVLILSVLFLKEKPTPQSLIGTMICVVGVMLLSV